MIKGMEFAENASVRVGIIFSKLPISPNMWTILSLIPALLGLFALRAGSMFGGFVFFACAGLIDVIDGAVARVTGRATALGAFLDGVVDRVVEAMLLLGLLLYGLPDAGEVVYINPTTTIFSVLFFGTCMTSFVKAYAHHRGAIGDAEVKKMGGILERPERLFLLLVSLIAGIFSPLWTMYVLLATALLSALTVLERMFFVLKRQNS
ncbi:MAG: CDP-alcohol phosphatidyltransferase family protein [Candidatus Micrarchaeia archaeon]